MITPKHIFDQLSKKQKIETLYGFLKIHNDVINRLLDTLTTFCERHSNGK